MDYAPTPGREEEAMKVTALKALSFAAAIACLALVSASVSSAQDVYWVNYFANNPANPGATLPIPDETVRIDNPGLTYGNVCAMIYVYDNDQQLSECCGCVETHNGLRTLSVTTDLTKNPLTGKVSSNGVIKIVSAVPNGAPCDPTANVVPTPNLRAWATHTQALLVNLGGGAGLSYGVSETNFQQSTLGRSELAALQQQCAFIHILGSGNGICTCGTGD